MSGEIVSACLAGCSFVPEYKVLGRTCERGAWNIRLFPNKQFWRQITEDTGSDVDICREILKILRLFSFYL